MTSSPSNENSSEKNREQSRVLILKGLQILDTPPEKAFDDLTWLTAQACQSPICLISFLDEKRQWIKSAVGFHLTALNKTDSICAHTLTEPNGLFVSNLTQEKRFAALSLVTKAPFIRAYAGVSLVIQGRPVGTLCVMDTKPRQFNHQEKKTLEAFSKQICTLLELKLAQKNEQTLLSRFNSLVENLHEGILLQDKNGKSIYQNKNFLKFDLEAPENETTEELTLKNGTVLERTHLPISSGNHSEHLWMYRDLTSRRQSEKLIQLQRTQLESLSKLSIGITGGIAHEINNHLSVVLAKVDGIKTKLSNQEDLDKVDSILENTEQIIKIIKALRVFSKKDLDAPFVKLNMKEIVETVFQLCKSRLKKHQVEFQFPQPFEDLEFVGKKVPTLLALMNLIGNSIDAVKTLPVRWIKIEILDQGESVRVNVTDSGLGIPPALWNRIMIPFFTTKEAGEGTGLGLCLAKGFIEEMGGQLFLDTFCKHTRFCLVLPKTQKPLAKTKSILIADDELELLETIRSHFASNGWQVQQATTGKEALYALGQNRFDMILSDIRMPEYDGLEFLELLRMGYSKKIPVIFITGYEDITREEAIARGARDLIEKPFKMNEMYERVVSVFSSQQAAIQTT